MNLDVVTIQDCIDNYKMKGRVTILNDGKVINFTIENENSTVSLQAQNGATE